MMLKKLSMFALALTASFTSLAADFNLPQGRFFVTGEYLYLLPTVDDTYFVIDAPTSSTATVSGHRRNNDPNFHSGYRVGAGYTFCECNTQLFAKYTNLHFTQKKSISGDFLWATNGRADLASSFEAYAGSARSKINLSYQRLDALYSQLIHNCCGLKFAVEYGLEAAELRLKEGYVYRSATDLGTIHQRSKAKAIGPQIGFSMDYDLYEFCGCVPGTLSLNVASSGSLLAAHSKANANNVLNDETILDVSNKKTWRVIPALHASVGLNFDTKVSCYDTSVGIGYEFSSYIRGLTRTSFPDDVADSLSYNNYYNFDVQGMYVSLSASF